MIIPAALHIPPEVLRHLGEFLRKGTTVVIESGAGFAGHLNFRQHRRVLREYMQIDVRAPVDLWSQDSGSWRAPYVDYAWPYRAKVRDFSRVVPLGDQPGEIIAWADDLPVALKRRIGKGTLIYLGSPLGPALWAGDTEARQWLSRLFSL